MRWVCAPLPVYGLAEYELVCSLFSMEIVLHPSTILKSVSFLLHGHYFRFPVPLKSLTPPACLSRSEENGQHLRNTLASCTQTLKTFPFPPNQRRSSPCPQPAQPQHPSSPESPLNIHVAPVLAWGARPSDAGMISLQFLPHLTPLVFFCLQLLLHPFPEFSSSVSLKSISQGPISILFPLPPSIQGHLLRFRGLSYYP